MLTDDALDRMLQSLTAAPAKTAVAAPIVPAAEATSSCCCDGTLDGPAGSAASSATSERRRGSLPAPTCTPLELLRLQAVDSPPRGLLLVVGCIGILLGLTDSLPSWEGCKLVLKGQMAASRPAQRRPRLQAAGVAMQQGVSFWQRLERFEASSVTAAQREMVLDALRSDMGGLMMPHHLVQVSAAAAALGAWVQAVQDLLKAPPPPPAGGDGAGRGSSIFDGTAMRRCPACNMPVEASRLAEHTALCVAKQHERQKLTARPPVAPSGRSGSGYGGGASNASVRDVLTAETTLGSASSSTTVKMMSEQERAGVQALAEERVRWLRPSEAPPPLTLRPRSPRMHPPPAAPDPPINAIAPPPAASFESERPAAAARVPSVAPLASHVEVGPPSALEPMPQSPQVEGGWDYLRKGAGRGAPAWLLPSRPSSARQPTDNGSCHLAPSAALAPAAAAARSESSRGTARPRAADATAAAAAAPAAAARAADPSHERPKGFARALHTPEVCKRNA